MPKTKKPFVDFRAVRTRITMEQVLAHYNVLDTFKRIGSRLNGPCPIHGGRNPTQFRVDSGKNLWNCIQVESQAVCTQLFRLLQQERGRRGMSKYALAARTGLAQQALGYVERGMTSPSFDTI